MRLNDNYGRPTEAQLAKSQAFWAKVRKQLDAKAAAAKPRVTEA